MGHSPFAGTGNGENAGAACTLLYSNYLLGFVDPEFWIWILSVARPCPL